MRHGLWVSSLEFNFYTITYLQLHWIREIHPIKDANQNVIEIGTERNAIPGTSLLELQLNFFVRLEQVHDIASAAQWIRYPNIEFAR